MQKKVLVGMSGGVDSTMTALLLQKVGYTVSGVHFINTENRTGAEKAQKIAAKLGIEFSAVDARTDFQKTVIEPFLAEYSVGRTPNPCVFCNKKFKFQKLLSLANEKNIDFVATGHYVRNIDGHLWRGKDPAKDQSFFLTRLKSAELKRILFPLGEYHKPDVQKMAQEEGLAEIIGEGESQDLCFVQGELVDYLAAHLPPTLQKKGKIVHAGRVIGEHDGLFRWTVGQRVHIGGLKEPLFVAGFDREKNEIIVAPNSALFSEEMQLADCSWLNEAPPPAVLVQIRHRATPVAAKITLIGDNKAHIAFEKPVRALTPGQSAAIYSGDELLGGGVIE